MSLTTRLAELEQRLGPADCPHCGSNLPRVIRPPLAWLTTPELKALRALWQAVVDRKACHLCRHGDPCQEHRGSSVEVRATR